MQINVILNCTEAARSKARYAFEVLFSPMRVSLSFFNAKREDAFNIIYQHFPPYNENIFHLEESEQFSRHLDSKTIPNADEVYWFGFSDKKLPAFFKTGDDIGFDITASTFLLASNYQDLISSNRDQFDRLKSSESLQKINGFLKIPVINYYSLLLKSQLEKFYGITIDWKKYSGKDHAIALTHDVDYTSSLNPKIIKREIIGNALINKQGLTAKERVIKMLLPITAIFGYDPPKEGLKFLKKIEDRYNVHSTFFFKAGATEKWDVNYLIETGFVKEFTRLLLNSGYEIGIHPSMKTYVDQSQMEMEKQHLEMSTGARIRSVRQHYLRFKADTTPGIWEKAGLKIDSTLGFPYDIGFRNSVAFPFPVYDFSKDSTSSIIEIPMVIMDGALNSQSKNDIKQTLSEIENLLGEIFLARGSAAILFHNSLKDPVEYRGFPELYEQIIEFLLRENFFVGSLSELMDSFR